MGDVKMDLDDVKSSGSSSSGRFTRDPKRAFKFTNLFREKMADWATKAPRADIDDEDRWVKDNLDPDGQQVSRNCAAMALVDNQEIAAWNDGNPGLDIFQARFKNGKALGGDERVHAELKVLEYCMTEGGRDVARIYISKTCCPPCAAIMALFGIKTHGQHAQNNNQKWALPKFLTTWNFRNKFVDLIGDECWAIIDQNFNGQINANNYAEAIAEAVNWIEKNGAPNPNRGWLMYL